MKKCILAMSIASLIGISALTVSEPLPVLAEGEESVSIASSEISEPESSIISEESVETIVEPEYEYTIKGATISYRDSEDSPYVAGSTAIGSYYLSAEGWNTADTYDVYMTIKGNITTKLESKVLYIYEYKPTTVIWNNVVVPQNEDKTYTLVKPATVGAYNIEINFTKTIITNPTDLTGLNWSSLLTVQNLMTIGSWAVIVIGILVLYAINRRYKTRGTTTLQEIETRLSEEIETTFGKSVAEQVSNLFDTTIKTSFVAIEDKLSKVDNNNATLVRCLLLMQENTPEARLAITKCLSELDTSADKQAEEVKALIEAEMKKYKDEAKAKEEAIAEAKKANEAWQDKASQSMSTTTSENVGDGYDGTSI